MSDLEGIEGLGFAAVLSAVFIVLKLIGAITWGWMWVLAPIWLLAIISVTITVTHE